MAPLPLWSYASLSAKRASPKPKLSVLAAKTDGAATPPVPFARPVSGTMPVTPQSADHPYALIERQVPLPLEIVKRLAAFDLSPREREVRGTCYLRIRPHGS
jgi:hypothetical protein